MGKRFRVDGFPKLLRKRKLYLRKENCFKNKTLLVSIVGWFRIR